MKFLVLTVLAFVAVAQAELDWSNIEHNELEVMPVGPAPLLPKIVGGESAQRHQYPHQLALIMDGGSFCGGTPIRDDVVLTAAHCVDSARSVQVIAGAHYVQQSEPTQQIITSTNIIVHEGWDRSKLINDIALVILPRKLNIDGTTVKTISIRGASCPDSGTDNAQSTISGWGRPSDSSNTISPVLRHTSAPIMSNSLCGLYFGNIIDSQICFTGTGGKGGCNGDSGGPMIISTSGGIQQVGIASFVSGLGCEAGYPTVYTRVSCFVNWINSKIN